MHHDSCNHDRDRPTISKRLAYQMTPNWRSCLVRNMHSLSAALIPTFCQYEEWVAHKLGAAHLSEYFSCRRSLLGRCFIIAQWGLAKHAFLPSFQERRKEIIWGQWPARHHLWADFGMIFHRRGKACHFSGKHYTMYGGIWQPGRPPAAQPYLEFAILPASFDIRAIFTFI